MPTPKELRLALQKQGFKTLQIFPTILITCLAVCQHRGVNYFLGGKAPLYSGLKAMFSHIDCSGFAKWALYIATTVGDVNTDLIPRVLGGCVMPDGSANQNDWFRAQNFKWHNCDTGDREADDATYAASASALDGLVRIAFCRREPGHTYGHVWFIYMGHTYESFGGVGPGSRPYDSGVLMRLVTDIYVIG